MTKDFRIGPQHRTQRSREHIDRIISALVSKDERPYIVTDDATIFDVTSLDESELVERCIREFGVRPTHDELSYPLWRLAELLGSRRKAT
jgi:hypothetical protein